MKNKTKKILLAVCLTSTFSSMSLAEAESQSAISGNISIANDYVFRGYAMHTDKEGKRKAKATIQGEIEYDFANGFKVGVWGSNLSNNYDNNNISSEFDFSASYAAQVDNVGYEIGYIRYITDTDAEFEEIYIDASYADFGLTYYKGKDKGKNESSGEKQDYVEASYGVNIEDIDILASVGNHRYYTSNSGEHNEGSKVYGIEISKAYEGLDYSLKFTKTSEGESAVDNQSNTVFSISKSF